MTTETPGLAEMLEYRTVETDPAEMVEVRNMES